jgi:uncharacterized OsmC-like protein
MSAIRDAVRGARDFLRENPERARSQDRPATAILEAGLRCRIDAASGAAITTDMPAALGGGGSAGSPGWLMRAALAACDATMIALRAAEEGIALDRLEVTAESESDDRGLLGAAEGIPAGPLAVRTRVRIVARGASEERLREIVRWAEAHSPVGDALVRAIPYRTAVEIDTAATDARSG